MIAPREIDGRFVPEPGPGVASVLVGREIVLGRVDAGRTSVETCALNESGSIVWQCFDGSGTIDEIAADIADVFGAGIEAVRADIAALAREVGSAGFLIGVREPVIEVGDDEGIPIGETFPDFRAVDEDGTRFGAADLRGRRTLLVNWSPTCSFCELIAPDLADLLPSLTDAGVDVVLLAIGPAAANRDALALRGLHCRLLLHDDEIAEAFDGLGTPVAYVVDERGNVAEPLALGANQVMDLATALTRASPSRADPRRASDGSA